MSPAAVFTVRGGSKKKYLGGLAPHHLGDNNEQNYCVHLCTVITLKIWGAWARFGGPVPSGPNLEPPLSTVVFFTDILNRTL